MKKLIFASFVGLTLFLTGCIPSLHPLYTKDTLVTYPEAEGIWLDSDGTYWKIEKGEEADEKGYLVSTGDHLDSLKGNYILGFVSLKGNMYADFYPIDILDQYMFRSDVIALHTFARVQIVKDELTFFYPDGDKLQSLFEQGKVRLKHEKTSEPGQLDDGSILITASTKELQEFIGRYGTNDQLFSLDNKMTRKVL